MDFYWRFVVRPHLSAIIWCIGVFSLLGCTATQIEHQALSHNHAFTNAADKILLANIIRSSRYLPVDYTAVTDYTGEGTVSGSIQGKLPFGADASRLFNLDPTINVSPGIASLDIKDFAQQKESFVKLYEDIEIQNFANLIDSGWDQPLVLSMLVQAVKIRGTFALEFLRRSNLKCTTSSDVAYKSYYCDLIRESNKCGDNASAIDEFLEKKATQTPVRLGKTFVNTGDDRCEFLSFQAIWARAYLFGIGFDVISTPKISVIFDEKEEDEKYFGAQDHQKKSLSKLYNDVNEDLSGANRSAFEAIGRSTHLMLRYLGQLSRAQLHLPEERRWIPSIVLDPEKRHQIPLFLVQSGTPDDEKAAVMVELDGRTYYIPEATYQENDHKSLHLFTYLRIRLDQAYAQTKLPPSNTLVLR